MATRRTTAGGTPDATAKRPRAKTAKSAAKAPAAKANGAKGGAAKHGSTRKAAERTPRERPQSAMSAAMDAFDSVPAAPVHKMTSGERERRFQLILQTASLKAGTGAAIATISRKVPFLGKLAPVVLGSAGETLVLSKVHQQLVRDLIALYQLDLSEPEERGVILLATAVSIGSEQLSKKTIEKLIEQISGRFYRPVIARVLPLASLVTEIAAAVASTYAVGKRAQALCKLPGTGAKDLGDLLRGLSGIDQSMLYKWSAEALIIALKPFRGALLAVIPGFR